MKDLKVDFLINPNQLFSNFLANIYNKEKNNDESFSYRQFAKLLGVSHGYLANIINGKRDPSRQFIIDSSLALGLSNKEINDFISLEAKKFIQEKYSPYSK